MTDEVAEKIMRVRLGIRDDPLLVVPLHALLRVVATSYLTLGYGQGIAGLLGDAGNRQRQELDRLYRTLNCDVSDLLK